MNKAPTLERTQPNSYDLGDISDMPDIEISTSQLESIRQAMMLDLGSKAINSALDTENMDLIDSEEATVEVAKANVERALGTEALRYVNNPNFVIPTPEQ